MLELNCGDRRCSFLAHHSTFLLRKESRVCDVCSDPGEGMAELSEADWPGSPQKSFCSFGSSHLHCWWPYRRGYFAPGEDLAVRHTTKIEMIFEF